MAFVGSNALAVGGHVPNFASAVMRCREKQVAGPWEELYPLDAFIMTCPCVDPFFWNEAVVLFVA